MGLVDSWKDSCHTAAPYLRRRNARRHPCLERNSNRWPSDWAREGFSLLRPLDHSDQQWRKNISKATIVECWIIWDIAPFNPYAKRRFGRTYHFHLQGPKSTEQDTSEHHEARQKFVGSQAVLRRHTNSIRISWAYSFPLLRKTD
jgi:hypothetical protein